MSKYIPDIYDKKTKVEFFYNEFKRRDANPEGFDCKMKNWFDSIRKYCEDTEKFSINLTELRDNFENFSCKPSFNCLKLVLTNMMKTKEILSIEDFRKQFLNDNSNWMNWGFNSFKKTLSWLTSNVTTNEINYQEKIDENINNEFCFINLNVFDLITRKLLNYVKENKLMGQVLKFNEFEQDVCSKLDLKKVDLDLIVSFLEIKNKCKTVQSNVKIIKFDETDTTISDKDISLMRLEDAKLMIQNDIDKLEDEIEKCKEEARQAIKQNNKNKGISCLRKKSRLTQQIDKKLNQYTNIETLEEQLLNSDSNKQILEVLSKSSEVLKTKQKLPDDVEDLVNSIEEALESHNNLLNDISKPFVQQFDDEDLEEELNQLIEEDELEKITNDVSSSKDKNKEADDLYERLQKLRETSPPTKKERIRIALSDDL